MAHPSSFLTPLVFPGVQPSFNHKTGDRSLVPSFPSSSLPFPSFHSTTLPRLFRPFHNILWRIFERSLHRPMQSLKAKLKLLLIAAAAASSETKLWKVHHRFMALYNGNGGRFMALWNASRPTLMQIQTQTAYYKHKLRCLHRSHATLSAIAGLPCSV